jgi:RNA polymerase sigma-70 factor (ECF subfamily)
MSATLVHAKSHHCWNDVLHAARTGDTNAFTTLISPYAPKLRRLAWRITRNTEDAEDVCQESLLKAFMKLGQFIETQETQKNGLGCWLMKITANSAIDFVRRKQVRRYIPLDECDEIHGKAHAAGTGGWGESPEAAYLRREKICALVDAINKLPDDLRSVCFLRNVKELSTRDVAARLRISSIAVRLRLFRARDQLRKSLRARSRCRTGKWILARGVSGLGTTNPNIVESCH